MTRSRCNHAYVLIWLVMFCLSCEDKRVLFSGTAEICPHYNCADATIVQLTDQYYPLDHHMVRDDNRKYGAAWAELLAFQYNIPLHVFERSVKGDEFEDFLDTGRGGASVYYPSCVTDFELRKFMSIRDDIEDAYGKTISTLSYGCGKTDYIKKLPTDVLGGRNSLYSKNSLDEEAITWYGDYFGNSNTTNFHSTEAMLSRPASGRFYALLQKENLSVAQVANHVQDQVQKTMRNHGFYTNFMHWDDYYKNGKDALIEGVTVIEPLFQAIHKGMQNSGLNSGLDYNEAIEYLYAREAIDSVKLDYIDDKTLNVAVWKSPKRDRDYSRIDTPVTIRIAKEWFKNLGDYSVSYSGQVLSAFYNSEALLLNIRLDFEETFETIQVDFDGTDQPIALDKPLYLTKKKKGHLTANTEAKFVLFRRPVGAENFEIEIVDRTSSFLENYDIPKLEKGYHYFCGAIDRKRQSKLLEL